MAKWFGVVTATRVLVNEMVSYGFMFNSNMPKALIDDHPTVDYGHLHLKDSNGKLKWELNMGNHAKMSMMALEDESPPLEEGLQVVLRKAPDGFLLMERSVFNRFHTACVLAGIKIDVHHYNGELSTS